MLDYDLAEIYGYEVKRLNEQVKRNSTRFPEDFMFQLTKDEIDFVKSQIATSRNHNMYKGQEGGRRKAPYAFSEQGIYMLATVLRGELAEQMVLLFSPFVIRMLQVTMVILPMVWRVYYMKMENANRTMQVKLQCGRGRHSALWTMPKP